MKNYYLVNCAPAVPNATPNVFVAESAMDVVNYCDSHPDEIVTVKRVTSIPN